MGPPHPTPSRPAAATHSGNGGSGVQGNPPGAPTPHPCPRNPPGTPVSHPYTGFPPPPGTPSQPQDPPSPGPPSPPDLGPIPDAGTPMTPLQDPHVPSLHGDTPPHSPHTPALPQAPPACPHGGCRPGWTGKEGATPCSGATCFIRGPKTPAAGLAPPSHSPVGFGCSPVGGGTTTRAPCTHKAPMHPPCHPPAPVLPTPRSLPPLCLHPQSIARAPAPPGPPSVEPGPHPAPGSLLELLHGAAGALRH